MSKATSSPSRKAARKKSSAPRRTGANSSRGISSRSTSGSGTTRRLQTRKESPGLQDLLVLELQEIHNAEKQLARLIPRLASAATSEDLRIAIEERLEEGEQIIAVVENGLEEIGASPGRKKNVAAEGLTNDLREHMQHIVMGPALDTVLIGGLQKTEHYCIAAWGTVKSLAEAAGLDELASAMAGAVEVGRAFDEHLTAIAEEELRPALTGVDEDEEEEEGDESEEEGGVGEDDEDGDAEEDEDEDEDEDDDDDDDDDDVDDDDDDDDDDEDEDEDEDDEVGDDDEDDGEEDDESLDETEDPDTASDRDLEDDSTPRTRRRPNAPLDPQPPVGLPEASIEDDAEDKEEEEEIRGRGRTRPGRDN